MVVLGLLAGLVALGVQGTRGAKGTASTHVAWGTELLLVTEAAPVQYHVPISTVVPSPKPVSSSIPNTVLIGTE